MHTSTTVRSADGTLIAFDRTGDGPPLILVEPAAHYRDFSAFDGLIPLLAAELTVYTYDRRGRGASSDAAPYAPEREVEDLAALLGEAGGRAGVYGFSSGALLGMHAAAAGLPIAKLALLEPPLRDSDDPDPRTGQLAELVAAHRDADAVARFHEAIGVPGEMIAEMRSTDAWHKMVSVAPTLVYDCLLSEATTRRVLRAVGVETLVLDSVGSSDDLTGWAAGVAAQLPNASHRSLEGEWHGVAGEVLAPVLTEFFRSA
jgi:pimeloyl-ACP methyl ester carboxylesterase